MDKQHKTLDENQVILLKALQAEFKERSNDMHRRPNSQAAYATVASLLKALLDLPYEQVKPIVENTTKSVIPPAQVYYRSKAVLQPNNNDSPALTEYEQLLHTIKTDGTDESKEENLRRWNRQDEI